MGLFEFSCSSMLIHFTAETPPGSGVVGTTCFSVFVGFTGFSCFAGFTGFSGFIGFTGRGGGGRLTARKSGVASLQTFRCGMGGLKLENCVGVCVRGVCTQKWCQNERFTHNNYGVITNVHTNCRIVCGMVFISVIPYKGYVDSRCNN